MSATGLSILIALIGGVLFWLDGARAREMATAMARELCNSHGVQFLDDSASLISLGLSRTAQGVRFRRIFSFSYYSEQTGRRQGAVTVIGARIRAYHLDGTTILQDEE